MRPNIAYADSVVSQFMHYLRERHTQVVEKKIVLEIKPKKGTTTQKRKKRHFDSIDIY